MRHLLFLAVILAGAGILRAEEWVDFNSRVVGMGSSGAVLARGPTGAYYNPANAAQRPWERVEGDPMTMQFDLPTTAGASLHGDNFNAVFDVAEAANDVHDRFQGGAFNNPSTATLDDFEDVVGIFNHLDTIKTLNGHGMYATSSTGLSVAFNNAFLPGDGLSFNTGGFAIAGAAAVVDFDSLRNYRFVDESGAQWDLMIDTAATISGEPGKSPNTSAGQQFSADLQAAGYPADEADILAGVAEDAGVNFGGVGASILFDFLVNTRDGNGQSLESGANPLEGNETGFVLRGLAWYEFGISYGFPLPIPVVGDWLSVGGTIRFIQAYTFSETLYIEEMDDDGIEDTLNSLGEQTRDAYTLQADASRFNVGFDLGVVFTPQISGLDTLAVSLVGRNLNGPEFRWDPATGVEPKLIRFDPQFRLGASYTLFHDAGLPLTVAVEGDLNKVSSDILPRYHTQFIRAGLGWEPQFGPFGFGIRAGALTNIADADQAVTFTAGLGLRLWFFRLDVAGQLGLESQDFGTSDDLREIPQRFGFSARLGARFVF